MSLSLKKGVRLPPAMAMSFAVTSVHDALREEGYTCTITSGMEGSHSRASLHYVGLAFDIRTRTMPSGELERIREKLAERLGDTFDVVLESTHIHIEHQPKTPIGA